MTYRAGFGDGDVNRDVNLNVDVNGDIWVRSFPVNVIPGEASAKAQKDSDNGSIRLLLAVLGVPVGFVDLIG